RSCFCFCLSHSIAFFLSLSWAAQTNSSYQTESAGIGHSRSQIRICKMGKTPLYDRIGDTKQFCHTRRPIHIHRPQPNHYTLILSCSSSTFIVFTPTSIMLLLRRSEEHTSELQSRFDLV